MKTTTFCLICMVGLGSTGLGAPLDTAPEKNDRARVTLRPRDTGEALVNPDMGWTMHFYSNIPGTHFPETDYALSQGVTLRDDSIMVQPPPRSWYHSDLAQLYWRTLPVILEHEHYGSSKARGAWGDGSRLLKAVEDYHASYMSIHWWPREELRDNRDLIDRINRRLGYRLQLREMTWPAQITIGEPFTVSSQWANVGVAPCYPGGTLAVTLKDDQHGIVAVLVDETYTMRHLVPGAIQDASVYALESRFRVGLIAPATHPGTYEVYVSIGDRDGTPRIALPLEHHDGQRRYRLGTLSCVKKD